MWDEIFDPPMLRKRSPITLVHALSDYGGCFHLNFPSGITHDDDYSCVTLLLLLLLLLLLDLPTYRKE